MCQIQLEDSNSLMECNLRRGFGQVLREPTTPQSPARVAEWAITKTAELLAGGTFPK
jgi:hypothetical protein